jgi:hypothetical protein
VTGIALPLALAVTRLVDVFDGRNVIAAWVPFAVLVAAGLGARRSARTGAVLGAALCAVSLAVIVAVDVLPGYQRDDWRGVARALPRSGVRVIVAEPYASAPLSIYLNHLTGVSGSSVSTRELDFVGLRIKRTDAGPAPAIVPTTPPPGFRLAGVRRSEAFAVSRFVAAEPTRISTSTLRRMLGTAKAELLRAG